MSWKYVFSLLTFVFITADLVAQVQFDTTYSGLPYKIFTANNGRKITIDDVITFNFIQQTEDGIILSSTYRTGIPLKTQVKAPREITDLMEFLLMLTEKDSAMIKMPSDSVFKDYESYRPPGIAKGSWIILVIKIEKVQNLNEVLAEAVEEMEKLRIKEIDLLTKYLKEKKLKPQYTPSGLGYVVMQKSQKPRPQVGDTVYVNYIARTIDGKVIDTSIESEAIKSGLDQPGREYGPVNFVAGKGEVIKGWDEGLLLMNEGSTFFFIIPSRLAFGVEGSGDVIAPFTTILLDVTLVKIRRPRTIKSL